MPDILLLPIDAELVDGLALGPAGFTGRYGAELGEHAELVGDVVRQTLEMPAAPAPWCGYLAVDAATRAVVGTCAFVGPPSEEGTVEIAYFTFPAFEGQGYATEMAGRLVRAAWGQPQVRRVVAHTLPEENASTRVLRKVGLEQRGEAVDAEAGRVWRWEADAASAEASR